jgi:hypothetical protein
MDPFWAATAADVEAAASMVTSTNIVTCEKPLNSLIFISPFYSASKRTNSTVVIEYSANTNGCRALPGSILTTY